MKIGIRSYGYNRDHLDGFGGLELRNTVLYAHFLRLEGHHVEFREDAKGCDSSFDIFLDTPRHDCSKFHSKAHIHSWFTPFTSTDLVSEEMKRNPCYQQGNFIISNPYRFGYENGIVNKDLCGFKEIVFLPIPYPDDLLPQNLLPGFQRQEIFWGNKGNFNPEFGPERAMYYVTNGIETLKALVRLNQRADFKITFVLDNLIRTTRPEWRGEVEDLIAQLKNVERLDQITWSHYLSIMARTKINTHVGGLTSGINECLFTRGVPAVPKEFIFFQDVAAHLNLMPAAQVATSDEIYDAYEKLWFDETYYNLVRDVFQNAFIDHRTQGLQKHWKNSMEIIFGN